MWMLYAGFVLLIVILLALDLGVFHRKAHVIELKEALGWSGFWIALGMAFSVFICFGDSGQWLGLGVGANPVTGTVLDGTAATLKYLTGYIVEKNLSVDNIFVIAMLFTYFAIPREYQHRILFWGILGALLMRGVMIGIVAALIQQFSWIIYVFGTFLLLTGVKMLLVQEAEKDFSRNPVVRLVRRVFPVTDQPHGRRFVVRGASTTVPGVSAGAIVLTPLALVLTLVEFTHLIFAVDSIPAIFAITGDPFIVFTSNVFAILGLRSLYFALAGMMHAFRYLKPALAVILLVIGGKMMAHTQLKTLIGEHVNLYLLTVMLGIPAVGVGASVWENRRRRSLLPASEAS